MKKNVVLFTIDTLRKDVLGFYGNKEGLTPKLDAIRGDCIIFKNNYSVAPYTQASFPGILTSSYLFDYPVSQKVSRDRTIIAEVLSAHGIQTAGFHSNPYLCNFFGWGRGWGYYYDSMEDKVTDLCPYIDGATINQKADAWLANKRDPNRPFFLWVHYMDVHEPYVPDRQYVDRVDPSIDKTPQEMFQLFTDVLLKRDISNLETVELFRKLYKAHVCQVDDYAGELIDVLKKNHALDNTTVIMTTDHGDEFNEHGSLSHDGKFFEELVHGPLVIYNHDAAKGQEVDTLVSGLDISPTIVHLFGLDPVKNFQGRSVLPLGDYPNKPLYGEAMGKLSHKVKPTDKPAYFCCSNNLKITYREEDDQWAMYDLAADPAEQTNIIDTSAKADEMKALLTPRIRRETL